VFFTHLYLAKYTPLSCKIHTFSAKYTPFPQNTHLKLCKKTRLKVCHEFGDRRCVLKIHTLCSPCYKPKVLYTGYQLKSDTCMDGVKHKPDLIHLSPLYISNYTRNQPQSLVVIFNNCQLPWLYTQGRR
jgi:hypothetical protein